MFDIQSEYLLLITIGALLILSPLIRAIMVQLGLPALIGYLALGFGVRVIDHYWPFLTPLFQEGFSMLAHVGVVALLFRVGLKSNLHALLAKLPNASLIWLGDVSVNLLVGFAVARLVLSLPLIPSLVVATALTATSVAVSTFVWQEAGKLNSAKGRLLVDVAELDDLSGVILLALLLAVIPTLQTGEGPILAVVGATSAWLLLKLSLFIAGCYLFAHYLEADFTHFNRKYEGSTTSLTITVLGAGLAIAAVAGYLGFSLAIGALFAGLAFSRDPQAVRTDAKFAYFYEFFTPFFFIYIGMQVDPGSILGSSAIAAVILIAAVLGKVVGVTLPARYSLNSFDAVTLGISMLPRAEISMVILYQCHLLGKDVVSDKLYSAMILVSIATSIAAPLALRPLLARGATHTTHKK